MTDRRAATRLPAMLAAALLASPALAAGKSWETEKATIHVETLAAGLHHPWGLAFLPDGRMLVSERRGLLRVVTPDGNISDAIYGVPEVVARGQGGLLDVALDPDFEANRLVYLSYAEAGEGRLNGTAVARGRLEGDSTFQLKDVEVIFRQQPKKDSHLHFGSRLVFDKDGHLFIALGERSRVGMREEAQDLASHLGKVVRIMPDGSVPEDNPFVNQDGAQPEIWSYGHRNQQGAALHPETGMLWTNEHGPRGGDELNIAEAGKNYGWPLVSHGVNYDFSPVGAGEKSAPGIEDPIHHWTPSIGVSGMAFYTSDEIPGWQGNLFVGGLARPGLYRLTLDGDKVAGEEVLLAAMGKRIRDVRAGPDGALYLLTDAANGELIRITRAE
ncbi:MAG: PQQ-dependent sugar dehydrogenase [Parvibaculum sp.]|uniref:PQQ-dependent sugar dehydrogenase n=1 Tax=Parvibaculum sp. TaxID=2024848 RepID=UPI00271DCB2B|nr:PQQ-dependent sugar dehydrogenase [Parvibaculum sp.]MDO8838676.1 PQQ-dependent sugar dehydrogenase [Parvibaculum sp.]